MKLKIHKRTASKVRARKKNKMRIRKKVVGTAERPRLAVFRSLRHMYAQLVDDAQGVTLVAASTQDLADGPKGSKAAAQRVGVELARKAKDKKIETVVFDRSGYVYHGRVRALADGAREGGLVF